jgi:TROVE domain-containing protein
VKTNTASARVTERTHEGGVAKRITPEAQLRRSVMSCLLWESEFYEDGQSVALRIADLVKAVKPQTVAVLAVEARSAMNLRHVPLLLCRELARNKALTATTLAACIQRADELAEFVALYWKDGRCPLSAPVKKGLARAFRKFNAYALAKYNRDGAVKLRDVLFLCHAKPENDEQAALWKALIAGTLPIPDTWEVKLSAGKDKRETWARLIAEKKLGALALLRNLRNMQEVKVEASVIRAALAEADVRRVLPFRFIAAARFGPQFEPDLEAAMFRSIGETAKRGGRTIVLIDVSGSMDVALSGKSDMLRLDAACGVAMVAREVFSDVRVFTFSQALVEIGARRGFALRDAAVHSQQHGGTYLAGALAALPQHDRLIVVTDEQSHDGVSSPPCETAYMINVASAKNGVGYGGRWTHIDGFSEAVVRYIIEVESAV